MLTERPNKKFAQLSVADDAFRPKRVLPPFQHPTPRNKPKKKEREVVAKKIQDMTQFRNKVPKVVLAEDEVYFTEERVAALQRKAKLLEDVYPECQCEGGENGPFYTHLSFAASHHALREKLKHQFGCSEQELRMEEIKLAGCEVATEEGCPGPKWIIQRSYQNERFIVIFKTRPGHTCEAAVTVAATVCTHLYVRAIRHFYYPIL